MKFTHKLVNHPRRDLDLFMLKMSSRKKTKISRQVKEYCTLPGDKRFRLAIQFFNDNLLFLPAFTHFLSFNIWMDLSDLWYTYQVYLSGSSVVENIQLSFKIPVALKSNMREISLILSQPPRDSMKKVSI